MDGTDKKAEEEANQDIPKVPIKTYRWEDVRRSRKRGAYPWTHLTKPPFDEEADPEEYTMDAFRRSRSTSTIGKSETQEISEAEELETKAEMEKSVEEKLNGLPEDKENVNPEHVETPSTSKGEAKKIVPAQKNGQEVRAKSEEPKKKRKLSIESSYSRISKIGLPKLDLANKLREAKSKIKVPKIPKRSKSDAAEAASKKQKVASSKPAETDAKGSWMPPPPNKTPVYIHIPLKPPPGETDEFSKYEFENSEPSSHSGSTLNLQRVGSGRKMSLMEIFTEIKKIQEIQQHQQASGSKTASHEEDLSKAGAGGEKRPMSDIKKELEKKLKWKGKFKMAIDKQDQHNEPQVDIVESMDSAKSQKLDVGKPHVQRKESDRLVIEELTDDDRKSTKSTDDKSSKPRTPEPIVLEPEDSSADDNISQYLDKDDKCEIVSEKSANVSSENVSQAGPSKKEEKVVEETPDPEKLRKLEATLSKWKKQTPGAPSFGSFKLPTKPTTTTTTAAAVTSPATITVPETKDRQRSKSEEPKRKRRSSIESSHSRKSLSQLAFIKRLKEAKDKIKLPKFPSFGRADKKDSKKPKTKESEDESQKPEEKQKLNTQSKSGKPVYIHIPLKLPAGQTDEFSYLAEEEQPKEPEEEKKQEVEAESSVPTSPDVPSSDIQLIFLTPPSDDEILDANVPETPSESDQKFFDTLKIDDLKNLARKAAETVWPENRKLETVSEDEVSDEQSAPESSQEVEQKQQKEVKMEEGLPTDEKEVLSQRQQQMLVDEEDGLKLSDAAIAMINEELEKELKEQDQGLKSSLKKKVSFKRKSRAEDGERIYEDVELSKGNTKSSEDSQAKLRPLESLQSMSVDEEKSYLDKKVIKDTSLEDDYSKWSKLNDHEYEPVNPPPEEITFRGPSVQVMDTSVEVQAAVKSFEGNERNLVRSPQDKELVVPSKQESQDLDEDLSAQEVQRRIEDRFFNSTPETTRTSSRTDGELNTSQVDSSVLEALPLTKEGRKKTTTPKEETGKGFNETIRMQAGKLKSKLQGIKKPNITLPQRPKFPTGKFKKPEFKKPNFKMPKMPERPSINLPSFGSLKRKDSSKDSWRDRQLSTESNAGDSTKKIFDFRTYPRIFDKYRKNKGKESSPSKEEREPTPPPPEFATVPRVNRKKGPVGSRWANKFKDIKYADEDARRSKEFDDEETQDVIKIPLRPDNEDPMDVPSHTRYNEDIDIEDDYDRENRDIHDFDREHHDMHDFDRDNRDTHRASPMNRDYLKRWDHGEFHEHQMPHLHYEREMNRGGYKVTDLDNDVEETPPGGSFEIGVPHTKEEHSSGSLSDHRRGVLEEIDSDEFFLREKGISQDNIEVGKYLSSEIREAFRNPVNALSQLQSEDREYDLDVSDQSEPLPDAPRRKPLRKPKRKKTPHVSDEQISFEHDSEPEEYPKPFDEFKPFVPPARPKRRSKRGSKKKKPAADDVIPFQETIPIEEQFRSVTPTEQTVELLDRTHFLPGNILADDQHMYYDKGYPQMYENEHMEGIEQPEIKVSDPYYKYQNFQREIDQFLGESEPEIAPVAPTRRNRSLKSLNASEPDSIVEELKMSKEIPQQDVEAFRAEQEYIIPTPEPPKRPTRMRSRTHSQSGASQQEDDRTSRGADSLVLDLQPEVPCVEEPCVENICDTMGYAVVDKSKVYREPPLPPSRFSSTPPPRARRSKKGAKWDKFSTVPRPDGTPVRPLRNYSTLGGSSRTSRTSSVQGDEKENIDLGQYIEIEDGEPVRRLQSGEVIKKMKDRPLPAPPRPPRRPRGAQREVFRDISHERNLPTEAGFDKPQEDETEVSTQTEPVPEGMISEEQIQTRDSILADLEDQILEFDHEETITHGSLVVQPLDNAQIIPHSQLSQEIPLGRSPIERTIPVSRESNVSEPPHRQEQKASDDEETSDIPDEFFKLKSPLKAPRHDQKRPDDEEETSVIPEEFTKLKSPLTPKSIPPSEDALPQQTQQQSSQEVGILKAQKMQVMDLDVDKLRVNELQANKIIVSELDGVSLQVAEINSKSGNLIVSGIELPPNLIQEMLEKLQSSAHEQVPVTADQSASLPSSETQTLKPESTPAEAPEESTEIGQKKTSIDDVPLDVDIMEEAPPVPPRYDSKTDLLEETLEQFKELDLEPLETIDLAQKCQDESAPTDEAPPVRPPRKSSQTEKVVQNLEEPKLEVPFEMQTPLQEQPEETGESQEPQPIHNLEILSVYPPESSDSPNQAENTSNAEEEPPPRPPQPVMHQDSSDYVPSQPPASFYALRSPPLGDFVEEDIPLAPRRKRHHKAPPVSRSSSEDVPPAPRRHHRSPEPSIQQLTGQLVRACGTEMDRSIKRLISHITNNVFRNADGKQDLHVMILLLLILIAGLILLSGDEQVTIHHHHWEFFNPPKDL